MMHNYHFGKTSRPGFLGVFLWLLLVCPHLLAQPVLFKDINAGSGSSNPSAFADMNGTGYFAATSAATGRELWKTDGTPAGTVLFKDINPGVGSSNPSSFLVANGTLYFSANDGTNGAALWKSDGTAEGTVLVKTFGTDPAPAALIYANDALYFSVKSQLWRSDGTAAGTTLIKDISSGSNLVSPLSIINVNGTLFLYSVASSGLWKSDGTTAGTVLVKTVRAFWLTNLNGTLYFVDGYGSATIGLWKSDGTEAGTVKIKQLNEIVTPSNGFYFLKNLNGTLYLALQRSRDLGSTFELWKSNGTTEGTVLFTNLGSGRRSSGLGSYAFAGNTFYYSISPGIGSINDQELLKADLTTGTVGIVRDIYPGVTDGRLNSSFPDGLTNVNDTLYFSANDGTTGRELWKSDGTAAGTVRVGDINPGTGNSNPSVLTSINGVVFFTADNGILGRELWQYNPAPMPPATTYRINAGGAAYSTASGKAFSADGSFTGGSTFSVSSDIVNTADDALYQSERFGNFSYSLPLPGGSYQVTLHFAEIWWGTPAAGSGGAGSRRFNVDAEGQRKLSEYDIFARAGGALRAVTESFTVSVIDGTLNINFTSGSSDQAKVSAIEVVPSGGQTFSGSYTLTARHSGKVLDLPGASTENGVSPIQYTAYQPAASNQSWLIEPVGEGYYTIRAGHSGKALDIPGASTEDGVQPIQYTANSPASDNQLWKIEAVGDGYYKIVARHSGKVLDVAGASLEDGAQVIQYSDFAATAHNQQWQLQPVTSPARVAASGSKAAPSEAFQLKLYPNPVEDRLTVQLPFAASQVRATAVTDLTGRQYLHNAHKAGGGQQLFLPVGSLRPGLYLLRLQVGNTSRVVRFSKR